MFGQRQLAWEDVCVFTVLEDTAAAYGKVGISMFEVPVWCFRLKTSHVIYIFLFDENCQVITLRLDSRDAARDAPKRGWVQLLGVMVNSSMVGTTQRPVWTVARLNMAVFVKLNVQSPNLMTGGRTYVFRRKPSTTRGIYRG